jgi:Flp pilus assembly protein TadD
MQRRRVLTLSIDPGYELAKNNLKWAEDEIRPERDALAKMQKTSGAHDSKYFVTQGVHLLAIGDYYEAIESWRRALSVDPRNAVAANDIGVAYMFRNEPVVATRWFRKAMEWDSNLSLARNNRLLG